MSRYTVRIIAVLSVAFILNACTHSLEVPDELPESAYECMQHYAPNGPVFVRKSGEPSPSSSFLIINQGKAALEWRLALVDSAKEHLDIQYFLWKADDTGSLLLNRVLSAADITMHIGELQPGSQHLRRGPAGQVKIHLHRHEAPRNQLQGVPGPIANRVDS